MAGDWIKVEKATARKPEVLRLADILGVHPDHAFGLCIRFWFWCDDQLVDGHAPRVTNGTLNAIVGHTGFAEALADVGWIRGNGQFWKVPNFDRHLSESAKNRALARERKQKQREEESRLERDISVTREERRDERENLSSIDDRETIGSAESPCGGSSRSSRSSRSSKKILDGERGEPFDLSSVDWGHVTAMAEAAARRVPPRTTDDRRAWLRFGVLAEVTYGEAWLIESAEAVVCAKQIRGTRQAHFVGVLKTKAFEQHGIDGATFKAMLRRIEIPANVWKSGVLEVRK